MEFVRSILSDELLSRHERDGGGHLLEANFPEPLRLLLDDTIESRSLSASLAVFMIRQTIGTDCATT